MKKKLLIIIPIVVVLTLVAVVALLIRPGEESSVNQLRSLPYLSWVPTTGSENKSGVTIYKKGKACEGVNIYVPRDRLSAYLMDMSGNRIHTWSADLDEGEIFHHAEMCENGDLFAIVDKLGYLVKMDWDSNIIWMQKLQFHHDLDIAENQDIYIIREKNEKVKSGDFEAFIVNNYITILSPEGQVKREVSLFEPFIKETPREIQKKVMDEQRKKGFFRLLFPKKTEPYDIFHMNSMEIIDRDIDGLCKKGNLLISVRWLDLIGIIDIDKGEFLWKWGPGETIAQHHPTLLEDNNILVFDNGSEKGAGVIREYSRVLEVNPFTNKIEWMYMANPPNDFFSRARGSSQRLPNGNTLISESSRGRAFEVTRDGEIVWEFYTPELREDSNKRAAMYRFMRLTDLDKYPVLQAMNK